MRMHAHDILLYYHPMVSQCRLEYFLGGANLPYKLVAQDL